MSYTYNVSVILVNYNGKRYIDNLFESLVKLKHSDFTYEIVFVDNDSKDGSVDYLKEKFGQYDNIKIVETGANLGFAGGNNAGVSKAEGEYIVLLNNDTAVDEMWLEELYHSKLKHNDCVMLNSKLLFFYDFIKIKFATKDKILLDKKILINGKEYTIDNKFCKNLLYEDSRIVCFGHSEICIPLLDGVSDYSIEFSTVEEATDDDFVVYNEKKTSLKGSKTVVAIDEEIIKNDKFAIVQNAGSGVNNHYDGYDIGFGQVDSEEFDKEYEINNGCGASIIFSKADFDAVNGFDERFFMYYEDTDLSYRLKKYSGKKIMYCPTSIVRHIHTGSSTEWSPFFTYQVYRNKLLFIKNNISTWKYLIYFAKQCMVAYRERNKLKLTATKDSFKIIRGKEAKFQG